MERPASGSKANTPISILCVEPAPGECEALQSILGASAPPGAAWQVLASPSIRAAMPAVKRWRPPVVVCDSQPATGTWQELLGAVTDLPDPPLLILTSRLADERLWAEALNLGVHDVLAKPYEKTEVAWVMNAALRYWERRKPSQQSKALVLRAAW